jgi:hypothetical protein
MNTTTTLNTKYIGGLGIIYLVDCKDDIINVDTSQGACTIILPNIIQNGLNSIPKSFFINDITNSASTNNITIIPTPTDVVNSATSFVISNNGGTVICSPSSANEWFINSAIPTGMISAFSNGWIDYSSTSTIVGWASLPAPTKQIFYKIIDNNKTLLINFAIGGTSNSATTSFTLPATPLAGITGRDIIYCVNNSLNSVGRFQYTSASNVISFTADINGTPFTATNTKQINGTIIIPIG